MAKPIVITAENFHKVLSKAVSTDVSLRGQVQRLVEFGLVQYNEQHNSNYLTEIIVADFHGIRTQAVQDYIEAHTDLVLTKFEDGTHRFKRKERDGYKFEMPTVTWWEYSKAGQAKAVNWDDKLSTFTKQLERSVKGEGKVKVEEGTQEEAEHLLAHLKAYVPLTPAQIEAARADAQA